MAFFAVLTDPSDQGTKFTIEECHVNLWVLRGLFGRRIFIWDVGLRITAGSQPFQRFQIGIPSGMLDDAITDLSDKLIDQKIASLIFARHVNLTNDDTIDYGSGPLRLSRIPPTQAKIEDVRSSKDFTLWNLQVATPIVAGAGTYLRARFIANNIGRVWSWKRFLFARCGSLTDVRFSDIREASDVKDGDSLQDRIVPIKKLYFFVVAPASYHVIATNPPVHYIRILEGHAWKSYLGRRVSLFGNEKLSIYEWRNPEKDPVSTTAPLRVYLDLWNHLAMYSVLNVLVFLVLGALVCSLGVEIAPEIASGLPVATSGVLAFVKVHWHTLTLTAIATGILWLLEKIKKVQELFLYFRRGLRRFEDLLLSVK